MAETALSPLEERHPLDGFSEAIGSSTLRVVANKELLAIGNPASARQQLAADLAPLPEPGRSTVFGEGRHLLWTGFDQLMSYGEDHGSGEQRLAPVVANAGYVTDVSDGWIALALEGPDALARLDLITMPDLGQHSLDVGAVTSTVLNHIRVLIWRQAPARLVLLSPASSGDCLLHRLREDLARAPVQPSRAR